MRNIFVINPHSGKKRRQRKLIADIEAAASKLGLQCEVYYTKAAKDGERYIKEICEANAASGEQLRIYACGGDGTINEAVNGAFGYENVEIGAVLWAPETTISGITGLRRIFWIWKGS